MPGKFYFECVDCKTEYPGDKVIYLCPSCEKSNKPGLPPHGVLKTIYQYEQIQSLNNAGSLFEQLQRALFLPLLPLKNMNSWPMLHIGNTPLYHVKNRTSGQVFLKDDSQNPTFSFKDRASALVSAWAKEHGIKTLVAASTGNAGSSLAGICASQEQQSIIVVPAAAPMAKLTQILMYGATMVPVRGTYDDAFDLSVQISEKYGFYNRNTAYNPLTIEGKKIVSFELYRQLMFRIPDRIFIPVGDGVIYSGVCKGFEDLLKLGIIDHMPVLVAVQADGSRNLINNLKGTSFAAIQSNTIADSISVDVPRCFHMVSAYMDAYHGESVSVSDQEILDASRHLSRTTGIFSEPAAAAAFAGMLKYHENGLIQAGSTNVVLLTGSGLKDLDAVQSSIHIPDPVKPEIQAVEGIIKNLVSHKS
jgi:threonine synthase